MVHLGDICQINGAEIEPVDVITGGSPCQDLSIAGNRKGLAGERSGLFMEQIRIIKEMREADRKRGRSGEFVRCRYAVLENVGGAFSSNKGRDFQAVLTEFVRVAEPDAPDVPMPEKGKWPKSGCVYDNMGGVERGLENPRRSVLGRSAATQTDCSGCGLQRTHSPRDTI